MKKIPILAATLLSLGFVTGCTSPGEEIPEVKTILPTSIKIEPSTITLVAGEKLSNLTLTFAPVDAVKTVTWTSLDTQIATVSSTGEITAIAQGTTKVLATSTVNQNVKGELHITVNPKPLTITEKINNSLGNIKFEGKAYKELYSQNADKPGTIIEDKMISQFTSNSYHFELGKGFDTMDFGGKEASLWYENGKVVQYLRNAFTNEVNCYDAKYEDGKAVDWNDFVNPMNIVKDLKVKSTENKLTLDLTQLGIPNKAQELIERVAFWPFEIAVIQEVTLNFDDTRLTNITFRTEKHSDKFQDCVYGASLDVVGYGESVTDFPKPEPIPASQEQQKLGNALKELDANNFVMDYQEQSMTFAQGTVYKTDKVAFFKESSSDKYSLGVAEINGEVFEIGWSFDLKKTVRLNKPITNKDGTKATFKEVSPLFTGIHSVFFNQKEGKANSFFLEDLELCKYFGNLITRCGGPFDLGMIMSDSTEVTLGEDGKLKTITANYSGMPSATLSTKQIGGEVVLPFDPATLEAVDRF